MAPVQTHAHGPPRRVGEAPAHVDLRLQRHGGHPHIGRLEPGEGIRCNVAGIARRQRTHDHDDLPAAVARHVAQGPARHLQAVLEGEDSPRRVGVGRHGLGRHGLGRVLSEPDEGGPVDGRAARQTGDHFGLAVPDDDQTQLAQRILVVVLLDEGRHYVERDVEPRRTPGQGRIPLVHGVAPVHHQIHVADHVPDQPAGGPGPVQTGEAVAAEPDEGGGVPGRGGGEEVPGFVLLDRRPHLGRVGLLPRVLQIPLVRGGLGGGGRRHGGMGGRRS